GAIGKEVGVGGGNPVGREELVVVIAVEPGIARGEGANAVGAGGRLDERPAAARAARVDGGDVQVVNAGQEVDHATTRIRHDDFIPGKTEIIAAVRALAGGIV